MRVKQQIQVHSAGMFHEEWKEVGWEQGEGGEVGKGRPRFWGVSSRGNEGM